MRKRVRKSLGNRATAYSWTAKTEYLSYCLYCCDYFYGCPRLTCSQFSLCLCGILNESTKEWAKQSKCALAISISCVLTAHIRDDVCELCSAPAFRDFPFYPKMLSGSISFVGIYFVDFSVVLPFIAPTSIGHRKIWNASTLHRIYEWNPIEFVFHRYRGRHIK